MIAVATNTNFALKISGSTSTSTNTNMSPTTLRLRELERIPMLGTTTPIFARFHLAKKRSTEVRRDDYLRLRLVGTGLPATHALACTTPASARASALVGGQARLSSTNTTTQETCDAKPGTNSPSVLGRKEGT